MTAIPPQMSQLRATLQQAFQHHQAGRLSEAERLYRSILQVRPDDPEINNAQNAVTQGLEMGVIPNPRTYTIGLRAGF